jgi:hypothetical protein
VDERPAVADARTHPESNFGPGPTWTLFEHDDGRYAVAPSAEAATFTRGDPGWHRVGPVEMHGAVASEGREPPQRGSGCHVGSQRVLGLHASEWTAVEFIAAGQRD